MTLIFSHQDPLFCLSCPSPSLHIILGLSRPHPVLRRRSPLPHISGGRKTPVSAFKISLMAAAATALLCAVVSANSPDGTQRKVKTALHSLVSLYCAKRSRIRSPSTSVFMCARNVGLWVPNRSLFHSMALRFHFHNDRAELRDRWREEKLRFQLKGQRGNFLAVCAAAPPPCPSSPSLSRSLQLPTLAYIRQR